MPLAEDVAWLRSFKVACPRCGIDAQSRSNSESTLSGLLVESHAEKNVAKGSQNVSL